MMRAVRVDRLRLDPERARVFVQEAVEQQGPLVVHRRKWSLALDESNALQLETEQYGARPSMTSGSRRSQELLACALVRALGWDVPEEDFSERIY